MAKASKSQPLRPAATDRRQALRNLLVAALAASGLAAGPALAADNWPSKPIKIIVPYTPGGSTDIVTRIVMEKLGPRLNQPIVVENRPGANSSLGSALAAKAEPDGYTFLSMLPAYIINFHLYKLGYTPADLTPVVQMADLPLSTSLLDYVCAAPEATNRDANALLAKAGFPYLRIKGPIGDLSHGERARLVFLRMKLGRPNLYLLDEPTNHLDIEGQEDLEAQLDSADAACIFVSHDRYFTRTVATRFLEIRKGRLTEVDDPEMFFDAQ